MTELKLPTYEELIELSEEDEDAFRALYKRVLVVWVDFNVEKMTPGATRMTLRDWAAQYD